MALLSAILAIIFFLMILQVCPAWATQERVRPILLGVDNAGFYFHPRDMPGFDVWGHKPFLDALGELGINFFVYHFVPVTDQGAENESLMLKRLLNIDEGMRAKGLSYVLNNETSNWIKEIEITPGVNEFAHPDGTHRWDIRMSWLSQVLPPVKPGKPALLGVVYDEAEHMQLTGHQFGTDLKTGEKMDAACFAVTDGLALEDAYDRLVAACRRIRTDHYEGRLQLGVEQVWPDMYHIFANAGWNVCTKILKEHLSSVVMSITLGAAVQYQDRVPGFWVTPDLWWLGDYPGHSPEALRSALLTSYWLGADAIYVENLDWPHSKQRHPKADEGGLLHWVDQDTYRITTHGKVLQDFAKNYVPNHPRRVDWRDYRPRVAIVRLPDGAWGQKDTAFRDRLLGNRTHPMDDASAEWLDVWPILTHGVARPGAISYNNQRVYPETHYKFFVPIDSVAVFDHLVTGKALDSVECFVVCGHALSAETFQAIKKRVADGATCIIARRLYDKHAEGTLPGKWTIVDSFSDETVATALSPFLGPPDVARFTFKDYVVEFRPAEDQDIVSVRVVDKEK